MRRHHRNAEVLRDRGGRTCELGAVWANQKVDLVVDHQLLVKLRHEFRLRFVIVVAQGNAVPLAANSEASVPIDGVDVELVPVARVRSFGGPLSRNRNGETEGDGSDVTRRAPS